MLPAMAPLLLVEDRDSLRAMLRATLEGAGYEVEEAADETSAIRALGGGRFLAVITDLKLPGATGHQVLAAAREADPNLPVIIMTAYGTVEDAVGAMKKGAFDFLAKPVDPDHLLLLVERAVERRDLVEENVLLKKEFADRTGFPRIIGEGDALIEATRRIQKAAPTDATVLLLGESGTGKELFARAIHQLSPRKRGPFVAINCAAIPETLLESELFGHERGAFTGASSMKLGRVETADRGTLFLDEIGDLSPALQAKLLRVLQDQTFERVGGTRPIQADVRFIAATNRDLGQAVRQGQFRLDLFYRLHVVTMTLPPLRERASDVPALARHFLERSRREVKREVAAFTPEALACLRRHTWPGNVRELENAIERAVVLADGPDIAIRDLPAEIRDGAAAAALVRERARSFHASVEEYKRGLIASVLRRTGGNRTQAARILGLQRTYLARLIRDLGLAGASGATEADGERLAVASE